jgi:hypothetical protein
MRNTLEPDDDLGCCRRERLPGTDEDGDAGPAPVLDLEAKGDEGLGVGPWLDAFDVLVPDILAAHRDLRIRRRHCPEHVLPPPGNCVVVARRRLHRDEREHLQEMVLHDVADRPDRVVEPASRLGPEVLGHGDLDRLDVLPVPDGLEEGVREPEVHDVLDRFLSKEVVDPEESLLGEDRRQPSV